MAVALHGTNPIGGSTLVCDHCSSCAAFPVACACLFDIHFSTIMISCAIRADFCLAKRVYHASCSTVPSRSWGRGDLLELQQEPISAVFCRDSFKHTTGNKIVPRSLGKMLISSRVPAIPKYSIMPGTITPKIPKIFLTDVC